MDGYEKFWISFWKVIGTVFVMTVGITALSTVANNYRWYQSWNMCVEAGGQPKQESLVGTSNSALTCVRK